MKSILKPIIIVCSFFFICLTGNSQFNSSFEEKTFRSSEKDSCEVFDLLHAINYNSNLYNLSKKQIDAHIKELSAKNIALKPLKKQVQIIYKSTHARFLKKYEGKAFFGDIFRNGNYNCVSASALYVLIFDAFNINYAIKETPTHVYVIADTLGLQTLIETTLPGTGVVNFNDRFKKDYIAYLNQNKIISDSEFNSTTTDELFREYYSKDLSITKLELAALQYYNKGIFLMNEEKYTGAVGYFDKALKIYPSNTIKYMHYAALQNSLSDDYSNKIYDGKLYGNLVLSSLSDTSFMQLVIDYFNNISIELCATSPNITRYNSFYNDILSLCSEQDVPKHLKQKYHYYIAYNYAVNNKYTEAFSEIKNAYLLGADNLVVKELAVDIGIKHLFIERRYKSQIDSMEYYFKELPFLFENKLFQQQYIYYFMKVISNAFMYDEPSEGEEYFKRFMKVLKDKEVQYYSDEHISIGFGIMAQYYMSQMNFSKASNVTSIGLELAPNSLQLNQVKKEIKEAREMKANYDKYVSNEASHKQITYLNNGYVTAEELKEKVNKYFPGNWKAVFISMEDMEQKLTEEESFEFVSEKNKNCTYTQNGKTEKGKWSYRLKSRCIYFVPNSNKDNYKVFKVKEMSSDKIVLLPYKDQKTPSPYKYVLQPN